MYTYIVCASIKVLGIYIDGSMCFRQSIGLGSARRGVFVVLELDPRSRSKSLNLSKK